MVLYLFNFVNISWYCFNMLLFSSMLCLIMLNSFAMLFTMLQRTEQVPIELDISAIKSML